MADGPSDQDVNKSREHISKKYLKDRVNKTNILTIFEKKIYLSIE